MWSGGIRTNLNKAAWGPKCVEFVLWTSTKLTLNIQSLKGNFYYNGFKSKVLPNAQSFKEACGASKLILTSFWNLGELINSFETNE